MLQIDDFNWFEAKVFLLGIHNADALACFKKKKKSNFFLFWVVMDFSKIFNLGPWKVFSGTFIYVKIMIEMDTVGDRSDMLLFYSVFQCIVVN